MREERAKSLVSCEVFLTEFALTSVERKSITEVESSNERRAKVSCENHKDETMGMAGSSVATTCSTALLACQDIEDDERPGALIQCLSESGTIDPEKYLLYTEKQNEMEVAEDSLVLAVLEERKRQKYKKPKRKLYRRKKSLAPYYFDENGQMVVLLPRQTVWYLTYVRSPATGDPKFKKKFRRRFRMPHEEYCRLVDMCKQNDRFSRWVSGRDCVGKKASPIELLVLGALRYLGRGLTFDDLEEYTAIHEETHRVFFHVFIKWGGKVLHPLLVRFPTTADEYARHVPEFATGGLAGAGYSTGHRHHPGAGVRNAYLADW